MMKRAWRTWIVLLLVLCGLGPIGYAHAEPASAPHRYLNIPFAEATPDMVAWRNEHKLKARVNPTGWLVETFRRLLMAQCRKTSRERKKLLFSLDDDAQRDMPDPSATPPEDIIWNAEQLALLRRLLGETDAELFVQYCIKHLIFWPIG